MAAHLIYLKSRRLLPPDQQPPGEDSIEEDDPRWELIRQLIEYKKFKDVAGHLQAVEMDAARPVSAPPGRRRRNGACRTDAAGALALGDIGRVRPAERVPEDAAPVRDEKTAGARTRTVIFEENYTVADKIDTLRGLMAQSRGQPLAFSPTVCAGSLAGGEWS